MRRKLLAARADLAERLADEARKRGSTVYAFLNEIIQGFLQVGGDKSFSELVETNRAVQLAKMMGLVLAPPALWDDCSVAYDDAENVGRNAALYLKNSEGNTAKSIESFIRSLCWNASFFSLEFQEYKTTLQVIGRDISEKQMEFILSVARGALTALGYVETNRTISKGLATVTYTKTRCSELNLVVLEGYFFYCIVKE